MLAGPSRAATGCRSIPSGPHQLLARWIVRGSNRSKSYQPMRSCRSVLSKPLG